MKEYVILNSTKEYGKLKRNLTLSTLTKSSPQIQELIKQQDMTWDKIVRKLLPEKKEEQPIRHTKLHIFDFKARIIGRDALEPQ